MLHNIIFTTISHKNYGERNEEKIKKCDKINNVIVFFLSKKMVRAKNQVLRHVNKTSQ